MANNYIGLQIIGCLYHWNRAIDNQVSIKGLGRLRKQCPAFVQVVRLVKAFAFVPPHGLPDAMQAVVDFSDDHMEVSIYI